MILELIAGALCLAMIAAAWKGRDIRDLIDAADDLDHATCADPLCDAVICYCPTDCPDTEPTACAHHTPLCAEHAVAECVDCRMDAADSRYQRYEREGSL